MHFLDAWTGLSPLDLVRLLAPAAAIALATFLPGRRFTRLGALVVAAALPTLRELGSFGPELGGWVALWLTVAWLAGSSRPVVPRPSRGHAGTLEAGSLGVVLGLVLLVLLIAAVARADLAPDATRRASSAMLLLSLGFIHLMLRRHALRAALAFAAMGLGLRMLEGAALAAVIPPGAPQQSALLLATWVAVLLVLQLAAGRERFTGTAWVSDAHDLHD